MTETRTGSSVLNNEIVEMLNSLSKQVDAISMWLDGGEATRISASLLAATYVGVKDLYDQLDEIKKRLGASKDRMSYTMLPRAFEDEGQSSITLSSGHRITISSKLRASIGENRDEAYVWLRDHDFGDIITETVNASTLSALAKGLAEEGKGLPEELFNTSIAQVASVTKVRKS